MTAIQSTKAELTKLPQGRLVVGRKEGLEGGAIKGKGKATEKRGEDAGSVSEREGSETADEEDKANIQDIRNLSGRSGELQVHPYDSQDLNLYPAHFQDFSQTYANPLR